MLDRCEELARIEAAMPTGGRPRQLSVRTLLLGLMLAISDDRQGQLRRAHRALVALSRHDQRRLGVLVRWRSGDHLLTYRQFERTFGVMIKVLPCEDGRAGAALTVLVDSLVRASVAARYETASSSLAVDWTDQETWSCPPPKGSDRCADPEASFGRRHSNTPGVRDEIFFGYYLQLATMVREEKGEEVPELVRAMALSTCRLDPPRELLPVLERLVASGALISDVIADCGYSHRRAEDWAVPLRLLGASPVTDLHSHDRGPKGTFEGAISCNGNLYCPATPPQLLQIGALSHGANEEEIKAHDRKVEELARYKLSPLSAHDADGYHRVMCPAVAGKLRCALRCESLSLSHARPSVISPPERELAPRCCVQKTITVPPEVNAKTAQRHDLASPAHRQSYGRRSAAERANATLKDPSSTDITRGSIRLCGQSAITIVVACAVVVRNLRVTAAFEARQAENERRKLRNLPPKSRKRRRRTLSDLTS